VPEHLYALVDDHFLPTDAAGSPWHPQVLHGGSATGLMGHAVAQHLPAGYVPTRITMDLLRPVPKAPLYVSTTLARDGGRLKILEVDVTHEGRTVCRASAVLVRAQDTALPDYAPRPAAAPPGPDGLPSFFIQEMLDAKGLPIPHGLHTRVEVRSAQPWQERGRNMSWLRLPVEIVAGEPLSPLSRACLLCDLGNGVAQLNLGDARGMINADVTLALFRLPQGEWLGFDSVAQVQPTGTGVVHSILYDTQGEVGWVLQSVLVNAEYRAG
jgi:acyl-CoA thioesterase